jgi:hypothetical protein
LFARQLPFRGYPGRDRRGEGQTGYGKSSFCDEKCRFRWWPPATFRAVRRIQDE